MYLQAVNTGSSFDAVTSVCRLNLLKNPNRVVPPIANVYSSEINRQYSLRYTVHIVLLHVLIFVFQ